ncbi:MAG: hypothetical protein ACREXR_09350, partial [Gammaproteobacteria bacterium]
RLTGRLRERKMNFCNDIATLRLGLGLPSLQAVFRPRFAPARRTCSPRVLAAVNMLQQLSQN